MSYMVARMQKMKADNLVGIGNHNQRKTDNHSNKDIDAQRSHLNYDLVEGRTENYKTDIQNFIEEKKSGTRATRKDAVLVNEWIITSNRPFFEGLNEKETERFFKDAKEYFADKFGDDNIRYAHVHLDETTPHMHLGVVPFDKDNKLSAKRVFNRAALIELQDELPVFMQNRGFDVQRGEKGSERKNLTVPEYKEMKGELEEIEISKKKISEELTRVNNELEQKKEQIVTLSGGKSPVLNEKGLGIKAETKPVKVPSDEKVFGVTIKKTVQKKTGNIIMPIKSYEILKKDLEEVQATKQLVEKYMTTDLVEENKQLADMVTNNANIAYDTFDKLDVANNKIIELQKENKTLKDTVKSLKKEIGSIYLTVKDAFKRILGDSRQLKDVLKGITHEISKNAPRGEFERLNEDENKQERTRSR
ncbi:plasmid recombination protein [Listeria monocytogenes]|nr:plasmid recombination protein [Listeria monocytogenes]EAG7685971.1 plasmid recombination protein [Listeria monocytogenes]